MTKYTTEANDLRIKLQIFADNYAKAKLSQAPSVNMRAELDKAEKLLAAQQEVLLDEVEKRLPKKQDAKHFLSTYFTPQKGYPNFDDEADLWAVIATKDNYNQAITEITETLEALRKEIV